MTGRRLAEIIRGGMADRVFRPGDPVADAAMVQHLIRGLITAGLNGQLGMTEEQAIDTTYEFVLRALQLAPAAPEELSLRAVR